MTALPWRDAPPDRRAVRLIARTRCPAANLCRCCPGPAGHGHFKPGKDGDGGKQINNCRLPHPPADRDCLPPAPSKLPPCPERDFRLQDAPAGQPASGRPCTECGRVTARVHGDGMPWCGGRHPAPNVGDCPECGWPVDPAAGAGRTVHQSCEEGETAPVRQLGRPRTKSRPRRAT